MASAARSGRRDTARSATGAPGRERQLSYLDHRQHLGPDHDQLGDPVPGGDRERYPGIGIEQEHAQLSPIAGVDQTWGIDEHGLWVSGGCSGDFDDENDND